MTGAADDILADPAYKISDKGVVFAVSEAQAVLHCARVRMGGAARHASHIMNHTSPVTRHASPVTGMLQASAIARTHVATREGFIISTAPKLAGGGLCQRVMEGWWRWRRRRQ